MRTRAPGAASARDARPLPSRGAASRAATRAAADLATALVALALATSFASAAAPATQPRLVLTTEDGEVLVDVALPQDRTWRLEWRHSVAQVTVTDHFEYRDGVMLVTGQVAPHLDIAGLGGFAGRGTMEQLPDGRYRLQNIDLPLHGNVHNVIIGTERAPSVLVVGGSRFELSRMRPGTHARLEVVHR